MKHILSVWDLWSTQWPSFETVSVSFPLLAERTWAHRLSLQLCQPISFWFFSPSWFIRMFPIFVPQGTHRTSSKHTQCSSFFPKNQKEKAPPHKINNPPTHSLKQIPRGRDDQPCVVPHRSSSCCLLQWRALLVRVISLECHAVGHPGEVWDSQTQEYLIPGFSLTPLPERQAFYTRAI